MTLPALAVLAACVAAASLHVATGCEKVPFENEKFVGECCIRLKVKPGSVALPKGQISAILNWKLGYQDQGPLVPREPGHKVAKETLQGKNVPWEWMEQKYYSGQFP